MITRVTYHWVALAMIACFWSLSAPAQAQLRVTTSPHEHVAAGDVVTQFLIWEGNQAIDGLIAQLPADWSLLAVQVSDESGRFAKGTDLLFEQRADAAWTVMEEGLVLLPGRTVRLTMRTGRAASSEIRYVPIRRTGDGWSEMQADAAEALWDVVAPSSRALNKALRLDGSMNEAPTLAVETGAPSSAESWTLTWWMKSIGLDQVVLSTWTGFESDSYPIEGILDAAGHVTVFAGRDRQHFAMRSVLPVSDGTWHHIAVVHDASKRKMRLHVDGAAQDSLLFTSDGSRAAGFSSLRLGYRLEEARPELSRPFQGELDELILFADAIGEESLSAIRDRISMPSSSTVWSMKFDDPDGAHRRLSSSVNTMLVPSILSVRKAASDLRALHGPDGVELSFKPGDEAVVGYQIDVSSDGELFSMATVIDWDPAQQGRVAWLDRTPSQGVQHYRVTAMYPDGPGTTSPVIKVGSGTDEPISRVHLEGNFPNPFNPTTTVRYEVFEAEHVRVSIWDLSGQMISQPVDGLHQPGHYEVGFDAGTLPSGTYFVRLESLSGIQTHQMILMK